MSNARTTTRPRRGLNLVEAALYIGVSPDKFTALMDAGRMPQPRLIDSLRVWDVDELDVYFLGFPRDSRDARQRRDDKLRLAQPFIPK